MFKLVNGWEGLKCLDEHVSLVSSMSAPPTVYTTLIVALQSMENSWLGKMVIHKHNETAIDCVSVVKLAVRLVHAMSAREYVTQKPQRHTESWHRRRADIPRRQVPHTNLRLEDFYGELVVGKPTEPTTLPVAQQLTMHTGQDNSAGNKLNQHNETKRGCHVEASRLRAGRLLTPPVSQT